MKILLSLMISLFSLSSFASMIEVKVSGMVCSMCAQGIQKKFKDESAVKGLHVDMDNKLVHLETKDGKDISDIEITKLIKEAGYNVESIQRK